MKKVLKAFGFIAIVAIIGFSFAACGGGDDDDGGSNNNNNNNSGGTTGGQQCTITITGITGKNGQDAYVEFWYNDHAVGAGGKEKISNNSVTIPLIDLAGKPLTITTPVYGFPFVFKLGTGDNINIQDPEKGIKNMYVYTQGNTLEELNINASTTPVQTFHKLPTCHLSQFNPSVDLNQFMEIPAAWGWSWN